MTNVTYFFDVLRVRKLGFVATFHKPKLKAGFLSLLGRVAVIGLLILSGGFASGCSVGPEYVKPEINIQETFPVQDGFSAQAPEVAWWKLFSDERLQSLVERAVAGNKDLKISYARLEQARSLLSEARYNLYPTVTASGGYTSSSLSKDAFNGFPAPRHLEAYDLGFDASWELDLFGSVRRNNEARDAALESSEAQVRDVLVSLVAEVGRNYFQLRGDQNRLEVARRNAKNQQETLNLTQARLEGGQATELDTARARAQLNNTLATIPPLEAAIASGVFRLSVLLGLQPSALKNELYVAGSLPALPKEFSLGNPNELIARRSDVRSAERTLAVATAQVGVATANLYPRVTFVGNIGYSSSSMRDFGPDAEKWSFGPGIRWAAFDLGRVRAQIKGADANAEAVLNQFENTVLQALEETQRSFVQFNSARQTTGYLAEASKASAKAAELANFRYRDGVTDFITVLDAERTMLADEDRLAQSQTNAATALVAVYKSLGGGWEPLIKKVQVNQDVKSVLP